MFSRNLTESRRFNNDRVLFVVEKFPWVAHGITDLILSSVASQPERIKNLVFPSSWKDAILHSDQAKLAAIVEEMLECSEPGEAGADWAALFIVWLAAKFGTTAVFNFARQQCPGDANSAAEHCFGESISNLQVTWAKSMFRTATSIQDANFEQVKECTMWHTLVFIMKVFFSAEFRRSSVISFTVIAYATLWNMAMPLFLENLFNDNNMVNYEGQTISTYILGMVVGFSIYQASSWYYRLNLFGEREYARDLKMKLSAHLSKLSQSQHDMLDMERVKNVVGRDCDLVAGGFNMTTMGTEAALQGLSTVVLLFYFDKRLALITCICSGLGGYMTQVHGKMIAAASKDYGDVSADLITDIEEKIYMHSVMEVLSLDAQFDLRTLRVLTGIRSVEDRFAKAEIFYEKTGETFETFNYLVAILLGIVFVRGGMMELGNFVGYFSAVGKLNESLAQWAKATYSYHLVRVALANLRLLMDMQPLAFDDIADADTIAGQAVPVRSRNKAKAGGGILGIFASAARKSTTTGVASNIDVNDGVRFHNVSFAYPMALSRILYRNVSFQIPFGKSSAVIGKSGSGKSTFSRYKGNCQ
jgi:ABC-type multidrug transport system fused ATPase/permease subunit